MDLDASLWYWEYIRIYFIFAENYAILWRNIRIYFICTAKILTFFDGGVILGSIFYNAKFFIFLEGGGISQDLFYLMFKVLLKVEEYVRISFICTAKLLTILGYRGLLGSISFVHQNSWHFWTVEEYLRIYFICTTNYTT